MTKMKTSGKIKKIEKQKSRRSMANYRISGFFDYIDRGVSTTQVIARLRETLRKVGLPDKNFEISADRNLTQTEKGGEV